MGLTDGVHADEAGNDHAGGRPPSSHLAVEDDRVMGSSVLDMLVEGVKCNLLGSCAICEWDPVVIALVAVCSQGFIHLTRRLD